jgi:hypothetical protein
MAPSYVKNSGHKEVQSAFKKQWKKCSDYMNTNCATVLPHQKYCATVLPHQKYCATVLPHQKYCATVLPHKKN